MIRIKFRFCLFLFFAITIAHPAATQPFTPAIDSSLNRLQNQPEDTNKVNTLNFLSKKFGQASRPEEAEKYATAALALARKLIFKKGMVAAYNNMASLYTSRGNYPEALKCYQASLKLKEELKDKRGMAVTYNIISQLYSNQGNYPAALENLFSSLKIREQTGDKQGMAGMYFNIGVVYDNLGNHAEAFKNYLASLKIGEETGDKKILGLCHSKLGDVLSRQGNIPEALKNYFAALKARQELGDKRAIANSYITIGNIYKDTSLARYTEALQYYLSAIGLFTELNDKSSTIDVYFNIGFLYECQGNYTEAIKYHTIALRVSEETGNQSGLAASYGNLGEAYYLRSLDESRAVYKTQLLQKALENYFRCLAGLKQLNDREGLAKCHTDIGTVYLQLDDYSKAKQYLEEGLALSENLRSLGNIKRCYESLIQLDRAVGDYRQALVHYQLFSDYRDSVYQEGNDKQIAQIKSQYESEKREKINLEHETKINALLLKAKEDSLMIVSAEKDKVLFENAKTLNLFNQQQIRLQQLQIEKDRATLAVQKAQADKNNEQLVLSNKEKAIQRLELKRQKQSTYYFWGGLALLTLLSFTAFRNFKNQKKLNNLYKLTAEKQMAELQLRSLRAQLNPHFMFNSLNAIQELIVMEENEKSQSYLERFSHLLRQLLDNANQPFIPLRKEISFIDLYLSLEKLRLPDLKYSIDVETNISVESFVIPNMMLQPYIENALWHGLQHKQGEKKLQLHISRENGSLHYEIKDNGIGRKKAEQLRTVYRREHRSRGMELLAQRFDLLSKEYGQHIHTKVTDLLENNNPSGTLVEITVPVALSEQNNQFLS